jgi:opacity protein-like surface antigen
MRIFLCAALLALAFSSAEAAELQPVVAPKDDPLPFDPNTTTVSCNAILGHLAAFNQSVPQHNAQVTSFLSQVTNSLYGWYGQLVLLEGKTQTVPAGTFSVLKDGADKLSQINDSATKNGALAIHEIGIIVQSLKSCHVH